MVAGTRFAVTADACDTRRDPFARGGPPLLAALPLLWLALPAADGDVPATLVGEAVQASDAGRYCDALPLFLEVHRRSGSLRALFNAAEVAFAASDRVAAADLYRRIESSSTFASFEHRDVVRQRIATVFRETQRSGPGVACPTAVARCGDWIVQQGEQCDDGNAASGDGCDATCIPSGCGNGVRAPDELCDDGNTVDGDGCDTGCVVSACGNGVRAPSEQCDDGNTIDGDGCDSDCSVTSCGNGIRSRDEQCDDGNHSSGDGCDAGCQVTRCGNGVVTAGERCDDGNARDGDGCEATCTPTRRPAPGPGLAVIGAGAAALVTSGILFAVGLPPWFTHEEASADLEARRARYATAPDEAVAAIAEVRAREEQSRSDWIGYGALCAGAATALVGGGMLGVAGGSWLAATLTEEVDVVPQGFAAGVSP